MLDLQTHPAAATHGALSFIRTMYFPSSVVSVTSYVEEITSFIRRFRAADGREDEIEIALREALSNAIVHGNHADPRARVVVACRGTAEGELWITVRDQGAGFDYHAATSATSPNGQSLQRGSGIYLMQLMMDRVWFDEGGSVVHMHKNAVLEKALISDFVACDDPQIETGRHF